MSGQLYGLHTKAKTKTIREHLQAQNNPIDFSPLRHLIRVMRRYDLKKKQAPEAGGCATGDRGDGGHMKDRVDRGREGTQV